jgi:LAGLIDADG-like domain
MVPDGPTTPTDTQIAWAAGLYEGEGYCHLSKKWQQPMVGLTTSDYDVLQTFANIVQVGGIHKPKIRPQNNKQLYTWQTGSQEGVIHVLTLLMPYLHSRRKERAEEVLAVAELKLSRRPTQLSSERKLQLLRAAGLKE